MRWIAALAILASACATERVDEIVYRGERIELSKAYSDYDDYKNDPENIHPSERARVQALVKSAPVAKSSPDAITLARVVSNVAFPGYGTGRFADTPQTDGTRLTVYAVEIPVTDQNRYLLFRNTGSEFVLVDDFVDRSTMEIAEINVEGDEWIYRSRNGAVVFRRTRKAE